MKLESFLAAAITIGSPLAAQRIADLPNFTQQRYELINNSNENNITYSFPDSAREKKGMDLQFWAMASALTASTIYDVEGTFACPKKYCRESNSIAAPWVTAGKPVTYIGSTLLNAAALYAGQVMRNSEDKTTRAIWWLPGALLTIGHTFAGKSSWNTFRECQREWHRCQE